MATLKQNEATIADAEYGFVATGKALTEIRDKVQFQKAQGEEKSTFEDYCAHRWDWSRRMADRLIAGARVASMAEQMGFKLANEGQARAVADLDKEPDLLADILAKAMEISNGRLTAAAINQVRNSLKAPELDLEPGETPPPGTDETDPQAGEDWDAVSKAMLTQIRKHTRDIPKPLAAEWAKDLEVAFNTAHKKAVKVAKEGTG